MACKTMYDFKSIREHLDAVSLGFYCYVIVYQESLVRVERVGTLLVPRVDALSKKIILLMHLE